MPPKRNAPPPLSYVLRTPTMRTEYKGTHAGGLELLFVALPDALARRKAIDVLEKAHAKMLAQESGPDVDQATAAQVASLGSQVHPESALPSVPMPGGPGAPTRPVAEGECPVHRLGHRFVGAAGAEHCKHCGVAL